MLHSSSGSVEPKAYASGTSAFLWFPEKELAMGALDRKVWMALSGGLSFRKSGGGVDEAKNYGESERYNERRDPASFSLDSRMNVEGDMFSHRDPGGYVRGRAHG